MFANFNFQQSQVQQEAQVALSAKQAQDPRYQQLVERLVERLGGSPQQVDQNIMLLAMGHKL